MHRVANTTQADAAGERRKPHSQTCIQRLWWVLLWTASKVAILTSLRDVMRFDTWHLFSPSPLGHHIGCAMTWKTSCQRCDILPVWELSAVWQGMSQALCPQGHPQAFRPHWIAPIYLWKWLMNLLKQHMHDDRPKSKDFSCSASRQTSHAGGVFRESKVRALRRQD